MKKNQLKPKTDERSIGFLTKSLKIMKLSVLLFLLTALQVFADNSYSQTARVSLSMKNATVGQVLNKIESQSEFYFLYNHQLVDVNRKVSINASDAQIKDILAGLFNGTDVKSLVLGRQIILSPKKILRKEISKNLLAQQGITVTGTVTDDKGNPLPGVNILIKGTDKGTITNVDGNYSIEVPRGAKSLIFSFVGMVAQEITIGTSTRINVTMVESAIGLKEIVVTALGIKRGKRSLTYSTQTTGTEALTEARELNVLNSLEGKVAGLAINSSGSGLGAPTRVILRGNRSLSGDSQPLYVVDGVPLKTPTNLSPDDVASINVLKGPNAAALYGSAAQNGVIIIETKKGAATGVHVSLNNTYLVLDPELSIPFQNVYGQGLGGVYQKTNEFAWGPKMEGQMVDNWSIDPADAGTQYVFSPQPDNKIKIYNRGFNFASNLFVSVGGEKTQTAFSYTFTNANGIIPNNALQRHNISLRINNKLSKRLSLDTKINYINQKINDQLAEGESNFNPDRQIYTMPPNIHLADAKHYQYIASSGQLKQNYWNPTSTTGWNPFWILNNDPNSNVSERIIATTSFTYRITDALKLMVRGSYDGGNLSREEKLFNDTYVRAPHGRYILSKSNNFQLFNDFILSYKKNFFKNLVGSFNLGGSMQKVRNNSLSSNTGAAMVVPNFFSLSNTSLPRTYNNPGPGFNVNSVYAFGNIAWKNSLFLDVTGRNDWSSTLPADSRSYFYPSIGVSAVLNDLIPSFPTFISFAKLRASFATVGNSAPPYMLDRTASFRAGGNYGFLSFSSILPNPKLLPEKTKSTEVGLNMRFFKNRLRLDYTMYKTNTLNQLFTVSLPVGSGAAKYFTNGGNVQNKGIELLLSGTPVKTKTFNWDIDFNFSTNRNMVLSISDERPKIVVAHSYLREFVLEQGKPYGQIYSKGWVRDDQGRVIVGSDGMPEITHGMTVPVANFNPDWRGGLTNTITYKSFSLSFLIEHRQGGSIISMSKAILDGSGLTKRTLDGRNGGLIFGKNLFSNETAVLADGSPNTIPITAQTFWLGVGGRNTPVGEAFVCNATNTRLRELTFGYSLPQKMLANLHISNLKISLVGRNLFYIYRASPELDTDFMKGTSPSSEGFESFAPPTTRSMGLNLKVDF